MPEAFLPRRSGATTLHYDENCGSLKQANGYREVDPSLYPNHDDCGRCTAEEPVSIRSQEDADYQAYRDLRDAAGGDGADA